MLAWVLAVLMTIGACSVIQFTNQTLQVSAYAAHTQQEAVNWAISQIGQKLDYDGVYGAQCVDLIKYYYAYLGVSPVTGNGADYAYNSLPAGWTRIQNYSGFIPQPGDIAVWTGGYGHVSIVTSSDSVGFNSIIVSPSSLKSQHALPSVGLHVDRCTTTEVVVSSQGQSSTLK